MKAVSEASQHGARLTSLDGLAGTLRSQDVAANVAFKEGHCTFIKFRKDKAEYALLHNEANEARTLKIELPKGHAVNWDVLGDRAENLTRQADGTVVLNLSAHSTALIAVNDARLKPRPVYTNTHIQSLATDNWQASFQGHCSLRREVSIEAAPILLGDWRDMETLRAFSGTAIYTTTFNLDAGWKRKAKELWLDIGQFHDLAKARLNGHDLGWLLLSGQRVEIRAAAKTGRNDLILEISNTPNNAMIDASAPGFKDLSPKPAGLIGPVNLISKL
jgi:hypothetical protein